jgi:hypothetical protein
MTRTDVQAFNQGEFEEHLSAVVKSAQEPFEAPGLSDVFGGVKRIVKARLINQ